MEKTFSSIMSEFMKGLSENDKKKMMACGEKMASMCPCLKMSEEEKAVIEKMMSFCGGKEMILSFFKKMGSQPEGAERAEKA